ncbi:hypothetical protein [Paenibacillus antarcticus]|uniref:NERD domain-containing protein n=1 Tax=Paenibacillus antarcticus TaxID=253703 RepID=A0A168JWP2_9BACL|nr:hypothetical protein [Paenibacillus antarcticus]OAB41209.1 hypothetical protein PBAT_21895 [Paenibacillus antarcticus]
MDIVDFHKIESLARDFRNFLIFINGYMQQHSSEETVRILKISGIGVQKYPNSNKSEQLQTIIGALHSQYGKDDEHTNKWIEEVEIINNLFVDLIQLREAHGVNKIQKKRQAVGFLIALEIFLGSLKEYSMGRRLEKIKEVYPFVISLFDDRRRGRLIPAKVDHNRVAQIADSVAENASSIFKYFIYDDATLNFKNALKYDEIKILREHMNLYEIYNSIETLEEKWRMIGLDITIDKDIINFSMLDEKPFQAVSLSSARFQNQRMKWNLDFQNSDKTELHQKIKIDNTLLPTEGFISEEEVMHSISLGEFLLTRDLKMKLKNVELREWLRAYSVIKREMEEVIQKRFISNRVAPMQLTDWCDVRPASNWLQLFMSAGISEASAGIIINCLTFTLKSKDLLDCPFIPIPPRSDQEPEICVIPSLAVIIDPALSTISNMARSTSDIAMKGTGLENEVLKLLRSAGIPADQIKKTVNGETYECDTFFVLEDHLIFVECKAFGQPYGVRDYYQLIQNIIPLSEEVIPRAANDRSATEQLNRIAKYYLNHLPLLCEKLGLPEIWKPKSVTRIILTTAMLGENMFSDDCYIVDYSIFSRFIKRDMPYINIGPYRILNGDKNYEGDITFEKLMNIIVKSPQIDIFNRGIILNSVERKLYSKKLKYLIHTIPFSKIRIIDASVINKMITRGILPEDAHEQMKADR